MPKETRITLTPDERAELHGRARASLATPEAVNRLQALRLADCGWLTADIARHLHLPRTAVGRYLEAYLTGGFDALDDVPPARPRWPTGESYFHLSPWGDWDARPL